MMYFGEIVKGYPQATLFVPDDHDEGNTNVGVHDSFGNTVVIPLAQLRSIARTVENTLVANNLVHTLTKL